MVGDRTLKCWVQEPFLIFATYSLGFDKGDDLNIERRITTNPGDLENWFFVYFAYNYDLKQAFVYTKF